MNESPSRLPTVPLPEDDPTITIDDWVSSFVGLIREATVLTGAEEVALEEHLVELFSALDVESFVPAEIPARVWFEKRHHHHSREFLTSNQTMPMSRIASASNEEWAAALTEMIFTAYERDLSAELRVWIHQYLLRVVTWLDLSARPVRFLPHEVLTLRR